MAGAFDTAQQDIIDRAQLLVGRVNDALRFAEAASDERMRALRARAAANLLDELKELANRHPFIRLERLGEAEVAIASLLRGAGPDVPVAHSGDPLGTARANQDIIKALRFQATLQLRTPLSVLKKHGKVHRNLDVEPPAFAKELWHGIWVPVLKSWKELGGADVADWVSQHVATDIGLQSRDAYYRFLLAVRTVAADRTIPKASRREAVVAEASKPEWLEFTQKHGGAESVAAKVLDN